MSLLSDFFKRRKPSERGEWRGPPGDALRDLLLFMEACFAMTDGRRIEREQQRLGSVWFFLGAADHIGRHYHLDLETRRRLNREVLKKLGFDEDETRWLADAERQPAVRALSYGAAAEGRAAVSRWLEGRDNDAPLLYSQLLSEWRREH